MVYTSKPADYPHYIIHNICSELISPPKNECLTFIVVLGHDIGASLASRSRQSHPDRLSGLITLCMAYTPPAPHTLDLNGVRVLYEYYEFYYPFQYSPLLRLAQGRRGEC